MKLLVGYGNTLRQDDGIGYHIAQLLALTIADAAVVQVISTHQLLPELSVTVAQAEHVVFVDASLNSQAGYVQVCGLTPLNGLEDTHALTASNILYLTRHLYGVCPPAHLVTIGGETFGLGEMLSDAVQRAIPHAMREIRRLLLNFEIDG